jgi:CheY-like chemotaxis protein
MPGAPRAPILIVDDNALTREALKRLLSARGYTTRPAVSGREALDFLQTGGNACLILLDVHMPDMDGYAFRAALASDPALARIPVIVLSADAEAKVPDVVAYVQKTAEPEILLKLVGHACLREGDE